MACNFPEREFSETGAPSDEIGASYPANIAAEDDCESYSTTTVRALREAGVRFDRTTWVKISEGSLEFSINLAQD